MVSLQNAGSHLVSKQKEKESGKDHHGMLREVTATQRGVLSLTCLFTNSPTLLQFAQLPLISRKRGFSANHGTRGIFRFALFFFFVVFLPNTTQQRVPPKSTPE
jgi:hypothetical protein